jgi:hypothetical protein
MPGTMINRGNMLYDFIIQPTLTPVSVALSTSAEQSFTVKGLLLNDFVEINSTVAQTAGIGIVNARVSAVDTLTVQFSNSTAGALTPVAGGYLMNISRAEFFPLPTSAV